MDEVFKALRTRDLARSEDKKLEGNILKSLYLEKDPLIVDRLLPRLESKLSNPHFQDRFLRHRKTSLMRERDDCVEKAKRCEAAGSDPRYYTLRVPAFDRALAIASFRAYHAFLQDPHEGHPGIMELMIGEVQRRHGGDEGNRYVRQTYHLYETARILYDQYVSQASLFERFDHPASATLVELYRKIEIDLEDSDTQFSKYHLLSMGETLRIANNKESQNVVDKRIGLHFGIIVPRQLLMAIEQAMVQELVTKIAFYVESIQETAPAFEDLEYGTLFSFDALQLPELSKLYDGETYADALWVKMDKRKLSMTFEELCADFPELDGMVVTQLVHLEFFQEQGNYFISHLDHEYILYTLNEYAERETDTRVKGHKKLKTFKIDDARIPFDFKFEDRYFIFLVLDAYFKNKALIREYFSKYAN